LQCIMLAAIYPLVLAGQFIPVSMHTFCDFSTYIFHQFKYLSARIAV
jgi:hypothetical protein